MAIFNPNTGETTHTGQVISLGYRSWGMDSYYSEYYATVWCPEEGGPKTVVYDNDRDWDSYNYKRPVAEVDATPQVVAAYNQYYADLKEMRRKEELLEVARQPKKGKLARVIRGRKVPKGTIGKIEWTGVTKYGHYSTLLNTPKGKKWVNTEYIEVIVNPTQIEITLYG